MVYEIGLNSNFRDVAGPLKFGGVSTKSKKTSRSAVSRESQRRFQIASRSLREHWEWSGNDLEGF